MLNFIIGLLVLTGAAFAKTEKIVLTEANSVIFNQEVTSDYVSKKTLEVITKSTRSNVIFLVLDTPGGSVSAGLSFIDTIKSLNIKVHTITIFAASMGYQMVQELGTRYIMPSGHSHEP